MPIIKPPMWAANRAQVAPEFQRFWDGLAFGVPLMGAVNDVAVKAQGVLSAGPVWTTTPNGLALDFPNNGYISYAENQGLKGFGADLSSVVVFTRDTVSVEDWPFSSEGSTIGAGPFDWWCDASGRLRCSFSNATALGSGWTNTGAISVGQRIVGVCVHTAAATTIYVNGVDDTNTGGGLAGPLSDRNGTSYIGQRHSGSGDFDGTIELLAISRRAWSLSEVQAISRDPFGPFRHARSTAIGLKYEQVVRR